MGELVEAFAHMGEFLGRQPSSGCSEARRTGTREVSHQADGEAGGVLQEGMLSTGRDEEDGPWGDRMGKTADALLTMASEIEQELSMGMAVRGAQIEGLEMSVHPEFLH